MNKFLTLVRRDVADNRGALIITPLAIAALIFVLVLFGILTGRNQFGFNPSDMTSRGSATSVYETSKGSVMVRVRADGEVIIRAPDHERQEFTGPFTHTIQDGANAIIVARGADGKIMVTTPDGTKELDATKGKATVDITSDDGKVSIQADSRSGATTITKPDGTITTVDQVIDPKTKRQIEAVLAYATGGVASVPIGVAAVVILFLLAGSLFEERKDRSILFWKSMPVSDFSTVLAKVVAIVGVGLGVATLVSIVLHMAIATVSLATVGSFGITGISFGAVAAKAVSVWGVVGISVLVYVAWAIPVYAWIMLASAWAPKSPFIAAFVPIALMPVIAGLFRFNLDIFGAPLARLSGYPAFERLRDLRLDNSMDLKAELPIAEIVSRITGSLSEPTLWLGLTLAAAMLWGASEIRRRRAF